MADLDSRSKRASSAQILAPYNLHPPLPDATLDQGDRQHIAWAYSGILAAGAAADNLAVKMIFIPELTSAPGLYFISGG